MKELSCVSDYTFSQMPAMVPYYLQGNVLIHLLANSKAWITFKTSFTAS